MRCFRGPSSRDWTFVQRTPKERRRLWGTGQKFGLVPADWKYHHATDSADELYDMRADPDVLEEISPEAIRELRALGYIQ